MLEELKLPVGAVITFGSGFCGTDLGGFAAAFCFGLGARSLNCSGNGMISTRSVSPFFFLAPEQGNTVA